MSDSQSTQPVKEYEETNQTEANDESQNKLMEMELWKDYTITSTTGEYSINIEGIRFTNERNKFSDINSEHVIFLDYNYSNISETDETYIFSSNFKIMMKMEMY